MQTELANRTRGPRRPGDLLQVGADNPAASNGALQEANKLLERQDYDKGEVILRRLVSEHPRDPEPLASLAICVASGRGNLATAMKLAEHSRRLAPHRGCGWFALGYVNLLGSRLDEGYRCLEEGRRRDPRDPRLSWGREVFEQRRPGVISDLDRDNPLNRLLNTARRVATDHRVMMASATYVFYRAMFFYASLG